MAKEQKEVKRNQLFGFIECTPGQNLVYVLLERKKGIHPFGILSSDLDEATEMIREVVAEEEFAILCKGFGLNGKERLFKYEIANEFGLTNHQLDKVVEKAFRKICKKKKADLMKLVPDLEELSEMKKKLCKLSAAKNEDKGDGLEKAQNRIRELMNEIRVLDEDNKKLQSRIRELENEDRTLKKEYKKTQGRIRELENENYLLREKFANIEERYEKILETYEKVSDAKNELAELVGKERLIMEKKDVSIEVLELPQETIIRLKKSGFKTVDELCRLDNRALIRLKLGNCVSDIRKALYKKGFIPQCC